MLGVGLACLLSLGACGDDGTSTPLTDGGPLACSELLPLTIGQCIDSDTNMPCVDFLAPQRTWLSLAEEPVVHSIVGLQGSPMFVLSVSGAGIERGMDATAPYVELEVTMGDVLVGGYASRPTMLDDPNLPGNILAPQLYVVAFQAEDIVGETVGIKAQVRDLNEERWCTEAMFQPGSLLGAP